MDLGFIKVSDTRRELIDNIFNILKINGEYLYETQGLTHWIPAYPKESIKEDILQKEVFVVFNKKTNEIINTFQLEVIDNNYIELSKFATLPTYQGKGVGGKALDFIEEYSLKSNINTLILDVYDKSHNSMKFYEQHGFSIIDVKKTRRFKVLVMEKNLIN